MLGLLGPDFMGAARESGDPAGPSPASVIATALFFAATTAMTQARHARR